MISVYQAWVSGQLDIAIRHGIVRRSTLMYLEIYHEYLKERQVGYNYTHAVRITAERLCKTEITVKRAIALVG